MKRPSYVKDHGIFTFVFAIPFSKKAKSVNSQKMSMFEQLKDKPLNGQISQCATEIRYRLRYRPKVSVSVLKPKKIFFRNQNIFLSNFTHFFLILKYLPIWISVSVSDLYQNSGFGCTLRSAIKSLRIHCNEPYYPTQRVPPRTPKWIYCNFVEYSVYFLRFL